MPSPTSFLTLNFPPKAQWQVSQIPDLSGKVMLVTGGNVGIGKEIAKQLLLRNAKVYICARNAEKAQATIDELKKETENEAIFLKLDLADLKSVKAAADEFKSKESQLNVLFNNAGVMGPPNDELTVDGFDPTFATNVVGPFYFTQQLLPALLAAAKTSPDGTARVVNTSSAAYVFNKGLDFDKFTRPKQNVLMSYAHSKFANIVHALELHRRYADQGIVSTVLHPGTIRSELFRSRPRIEQWFYSFAMAPVELGALTQLWAGTTAEGAQLGGKFLIPWARVGAPKKETEDPELGKKLWDWLESHVPKD